VARTAGILVTSPAFLAKGAVGVTTSVRGVELWPGLAWKRHRRAVTTEAGGGCRRSGDSGELSLGECEPTAWGAPRCLR
jgi:hypothetical protein